MANNTNVYRAGSKRLLEQCVSLESSDIVAIVYDETTKEVVDIIRETATEIGIEVKALCKRTSEQRAFELATGLTDDILSLFAQARAILTCVAADSSTTKFRRALVQQAVRNNVRVGHMPGAGLEVLEAAYTVDFEGVERRCGELALALTVGRNASITSGHTHPGRGDQEYELHMDIGGLDRSAVVSSGRIPLGRWGNIPGGETFIAPIEASAYGQLCLNGAFRGRVLKPQEALVLDFADGRLDGTEGPPWTWSVHSKLCSRRP